MRSIYHLQWNWVNNENNTSSIQILFSCTYLLTWNILETEKLMIFFNVIIEGDKLFNLTIYKILRYTMLMIDYYDGPILWSNFSYKFYSFALILIILNINGLGRCPYLLTVLNCKLGQNYFRRIVSDHSVTKLLTSKKEKILCHCLSFRPNQSLTERDFF